MIEEGRPAESVVERAAAGAKLLTARGAGMRLVSVLSNFALIVLVSPADLGLLAVVRGVAGLAGDTSDLGFAWALLRRHEPPTDDEYRALGAVQLALVVAFLLLAALAPSLLQLRGGGLGAPRLWLLGVLLVMLIVPFGTGGRIRIERAMDYPRIAFADVSSVLLQNMLLLGFAITRHFTVGVFVATGATILYTNVLLWFWSPGPGPSFRIEPIRRLAREFAGFTVGHFGSMLNASGTPLIIAALFGLPMAGLWSFATRIGNVLQLAFEGFRRAAIPAAGLLARSPQALQRLVQQSMIGAATLTLPLIAAFYAGLPVVGWLLPKWAPAVPLAQWYVIGFGIAGVVGASVVPAAVAIHGSRIILAEQFAPIVAGWTVLAVLAATHATSIVAAVLPMQAAVILAVWFSADRVVRPKWNSALRTPLVALITVCILMAVASVAGATPPFAAITAAAGFGLVMLTPRVSGWMSQPRRAERAS